MTLPVKRKFGPGVLALGLVCAQPVWAGVTCDCVYDKTVASGMDRTPAGYPVSASIQAWGATLAQPGSFDTSIGRASVKPGGRIFLSAGLGGAISVLMTVRPDKTTDLSLSRANMAPEIFIGSCTLTDGASS